MSEEEREEANLEEFDKKVISEPNFEDQISHIPDPNKKEEKFNEWLCFQFLLAIIEILICLISLFFVLLSMSFGETPILFIIIMIILIVIVIYLGFFSKIRNSLLIAYGIMLIEIIVFFILIRFF